LGDAALPWITRELAAGRVVVLPRIPDDLPADAVEERRYMTASGMRSGIGIPVRVGESLVCVLTVGVFHQVREWPVDVIACLKLAGDAFGNAIARRAGTWRLAEKQAELAHVGRMVAMSELATVIAHELDQPLTAIVSNAQATRHLLSRVVPDITDSKGALDDIIADAMRAAEIVRRERQLLRKTKPNVERLNLNDLVREVEMFIQADARQHGTRVRMALSPGLADVMADRVQLQQVLLNLTRNAIQAMGTQPRDQRVLSITTTAASDDEVVLGVSDAGPPVDDAFLSKMFEPFYTTKRDGLGMGLSISRSIVQAHRGRVWTTRNRNKGLTMHVAIPAKIRGAIC
jgi:C4-dicarboxylate-specific signal transduction histidine kinase